jgi:hypothetical protein
MKKLNHMHMHMPNNKMDKIKIVLKKSKILSQDYKIFPQFFPLKKHKKLPKIYTKIPQM